jgi:hypothetical protein
MQNAINTIRTEREKLLTTIAAIDGVSVSPRGVDVSYALEGIDFRLGITIDGNYLEACGAFYDGSWVYFVTVLDEQTNEYDNIYVADGEGIAGLVKLVKTYGNN